MAYSNFTNNSTNVQFFSGTQDNLTKYITGTYTASDVQPVEGAFYLTTDTQRLYVGRKNTSDNNRVYAVQVSRGITFVSTSGDLPSASQYEEGDFYYIVDSNVLATLKEKLNNGVSYSPKQYEWVQINPPTGINSVTTSAVVTAADHSAGHDEIKTINTLINTAAGSQSGSFKVAAGNNIDISVDNVDNDTVGKLTISATDTTYSIGTAATTSGETDGATIGLKKNSGSTLDSSISVNGTGTVAVTSNGSGEITVHGPEFSNVTVVGKSGSANGMTISVNGTDGDGDNFTVSGDVDPLIEYGTTGNKSTAHFQKVTRSSTDYIIADLDVYTKAQADSAISDAITAQLATADAMTYKGVVTSATDLRNQIVANGGAHNGDVYKVGTITSAFDIDGVAVDTGDLIILTGTETNGQILINNSAITASTSPTLIVGDPEASPAVVGICELVPSGDEPEVTASLVTAAGGATGSTTAQIEASAPRFSLFDGKKGSSVSNSTNILTTRFVTGNKITVSGVETTNKYTGGQDLKLTFDHDTTTRTDSTTETLQNNGTANAVLTKAADGVADTIQDDSYELFVFSDPTQALTTDTYGHVTGLKGKKIVFKHNTISNPTISYNNHSTNSNHAIVGISIADAIGNTASASVNISSSSLTINGDSTNNKVTVDLKWQTF